MTGTVSASNPQSLLHTVSAGAKGPTHETAPSTLALAAGVHRPLHGDGAPGGSAPRDGGWKLPVHWRSGPRHQLPHSFHILLVRKSQNPDQGAFERSVHKCWGHALKLSQASWREEGELPTLEVWAAPMPSSVAGPVLVCGTQLRLRAAILKEPPRNGHGVVSSTSGQGNTSSLSVLLEHCLSPQELGAMRPGSPGQHEGAACKCFSSGLGSEHQVSKWLPSEGFHSQPSSFPSGAPDTRGTIRSQPHYVLSAFLTYTTQECIQWSLSVICYAAIVSGTWAE